MSVGGIAQDATVHIEMSKLQVGHSQGHRIDAEPPKPFGGQAAQALDLVAVLT